MAFKSRQYFAKRLSTLLLSVGMLWASACSLESDDSRNVIGERVEVITFTPDGNGDVSYYFDAQAGRIHRFDLSAGRLTDSFVVPQPDKEHRVFVPSSEAYVVDFVETQLTIFRSDQATVREDLNLPGTPISAAFDEATRTLVVYDDLSSIALVRLDEQGTIEQSWIGGPVFDPETLVRAGDFTSDGRLVLSFSNERIGVIDVNGSLESGSWQWQDQEPGIGLIDWVAPIQDQSDLVALHGESSLVIWDVSANTAITSTDLSEGTVTYLYKSEIPHFYYSESGTQKLFTIASDGSVNSTVVPLERLIKRSQISADQTRLTVGYTEVDGSLVVRQLRIQDGVTLYTDSFRSMDQNIYGFSQSFLLEIYPSGLGSLNIIDLATGNQKSIVNYNLPFFQ